MKMKLYMHDIERAQLHRARFLYPIVPRERGNDF